MSFSTNPVKNWGDHNTAALAKLVEDREVDIFDMTPTHINEVWEKYFTHHLLKNFLWNYHIFSTNYITGRSLDGARRRNAGTNDDFSLYINTYSSTSSLSDT